MLARLIQFTAAIAPAKQEFPPLLRVHSAYSNATPQPEEPQVMIRGMDHCKRKRRRKRPYPNLGEDLGVLLKVLCVARVPYTRHDGRLSRE